MLKICWDDTLPHLPATPEAAEIERWDRWFENVGFTDIWDEVKESCPEHKERIAYASMIELTRLEVMVQKCPTS